MDFRTIAIREIRMGFRNPWAYSFMALFTAFSLILLLINSRNAVEGYSGVTSAMLNLILYLVPLMSLLLGSFSLTAEKEEGSWRLLSAYPLGTLSFIAGKYAGLTMVLWVIMFVGYGVSGMLGAVFGGGFAITDFVLFVAFSMGLSFLFVAIAMMIGTFARNRWQALTISVAIWFFAVIGWSSLLVAILGMVPYLYVKSALVFLTFLNPAELVRLFVIVKLGGGSILGPEYYDWVHWISRTDGTLWFVLICMLWAAAAAGIAYMIWERGRIRE
ncbi:ABC transporter permease subunit [Paenibacillus sp. PR3]|uniref:ABC transporter permease subunit n=1 Tax=Paenibacillus terricola TaxID=2763503 RepID=A0ABR8MME4_9BACL|nr:ABC transporter permease subunit [Paenibacillus terricola]MBD3917184.1 ABC transporter permease subunit [Paenibacillus terricola]